MKGSDSNNNTVAITMYIKHALPIKIRRAKPMSFIPSIASSTGAYSSKSLII